MSSSSKESRLRLREPDAEAGAGGDERDGIDKTGGIEFKDGKGAIDEEAGTRVRSLSVVDIVEVRARSLSGAGIAS